MGALKKKQARPSIVTSKKTKKQADATPAVEPAKKAKRPRNFMDDQADDDRKTGIMSSIETGFGNMLKKLEEANKCAKLGKVTQDLDLQWELLNHVCELAKAVQNDFNGISRQVKPAVLKLLKTSKV